MSKNLSRLTATIIESLGKDMREVQHFDRSPLPDKNEVFKIISDIFVLLFPGYFGHSELTFDTIEQQLAFRSAAVYERLKAQAFREAQHGCRFPRHNCKNCRDYSVFVAEQLLNEIPRIREQLDLDVKAAFENDPAASSFDEIIFSYPGLEAIAVFRFANFLHRQGLLLIPRIMTEWAHSRTGVDIHPGASIGSSFFMDHGTGIVIGETTVIGDQVTLYQGVTLGALNFPRDSQGNIIKGAKRHPTIEECVVIYAGATILGGETVIGRNSVIGGNVWLTQSVPPFSRVVIGQSDLKITTRQTRTENPAKQASPTPPGNDHPVLPVAGEKPSKSQKPESVKKPSP